MTKPIEIVDHGRGPQLSTSRITVQDLVPYFEDGCSHEEIMHWIPVLTIEDIQCVERYVKEHYEDVMEQDRRIRERNAQRQESPEIARIRAEGKARMDALKKLNRPHQTNGEVR